MKLIKIQDTWYSKYEGAVVCSPELKEDVSTWDTVDTEKLDDSLHVELSKEFSNFVSAASPSNADGGIREISLEDNSRVAKFDSWHLLVTNSIND